MRDAVRVDRLWAWFVGLFVTVFLSWFILSELAGFGPLVDLVVGAVTNLPDALVNIVTYYGNVAPGLLVGSIIVGSVFGGLTTAVVLLFARKQLLWPGIPPSAAITGLFVSAVMIVLQQPFVLIIAFTVAATLFTTYVRQREMRQLLSSDTLQILRRPASIRLMSSGLGIGALGGALGSQVLNLPTQHCTFSSDADPTTRGIGLVLTMISALLVLIPVWTVLLRRNQRRDEGSSGFFRSRLAPFLLLFPTLISLVVFLYYPTVQIAELSLERARRRQEPTFVCMGNFIDLVNDVVYRNSFLTTFGITIAIVTLTMTLALLIAILASQKIRGASIYRTLLIWPYALSPVVIGAIFIAMFRDDRSGIINYALWEVFGIEEISWLTDPNIAPWVVVAAAVYNALGFNILFYIAGLQNVPRDLLEAAQIDGANVIQRFTRITLPLLSPFTFFLLVANITYSFYGIYGVIDTLFPGGGPLMADGQSRAVNVLIYKLYEDSFRSVTQLGEAAAQSIILFMLVAGITLLQFRYVENRVVYAE
ncbi:MAG: carbohydrate ABC transporter permease [Chloroflexota bacterium]